MNKKICSNCGKLIDFKEKCICRLKDKREYKNKKGNDPIIDTVRWRRKRVSIIKRDGGYCQRCFIKYGIINDNQLQVHHIKSRIDFPELAFEDWNLICICKTCNQQLGVSNRLDFDWSITEREFIL